MQRFWSSLAVNLGKRAGLVSVIGLLITLALGAGITKLEFATGQDAYLNKGDEVYRDNVAYQDLFGGQAMLTVITMDPGHTVVELLDDANRAKLVAVGDKLASNQQEVLGVITPVDALRLSDNLVASATGSPTDSIAGRAILDAQARAPRRTRGSGWPTRPSRSSDWARSRRTSRAWTTPSGSIFCFTTTKVRFARRCCRSSPTIGTR